MSIYYKVRIVFLIAFVFLSAFFTIYFYMQKKEDISIKEKRYTQMAFLMENIYQVPNLDIQNKALKTFLDESDFKLVASKQRHQEVLNKAVIELDKNATQSQIKMLRVLGDFYLYIQHPKYIQLLEDVADRPFLNRTVILYLLSLFFLFGLYFWLMHSLKPLKKLQEKIQYITEDNLNISMKSNRKDEIGDVANALDSALRRVEAMIDSRQLFLRTLMHELKTPIAKGKLLNEFVEDATLKKGYERVFERLNLLIEEFSKVEKMLSSCYSVKNAKCSTIDLVENALELTLMDEKEIAQHISLVVVEEGWFQSDFELLSLALKNLIDNAMKYAPDKQVQIVLECNKITIINKGERLPQPLESYKTPFAKESHGLGLGLYIVQKIAALLSLKCTYKYTDKQNIFYLQKK